MKRFKQFLTVFLAIVMCVTTVVPVRAATPVTQDGITMTVTPDKTTYSQEETITATVKVENTNTFAVTDLSLEGITPEGYELKVGEGDNLTIGELAAGASKELAVSFVPKTTSGEGGDNIEDVVIYYKENFEYEGDEADYFTNGSTNPSGIYVPTVANASTTAVTDGTDKALNIIGSSAAGSGTFRTDARWSRENTWSDSTSVTDLSSKHVVYEFDLKLQGTSGNNLVVQLRSVSTSGSGVFSTILKMENNVLYDGLTPLTTSLSLDKDYHIAIVCDFANKTRDIYLDDVCISGTDGLAMGSAASFNSAKVNDCLRLSCWKALDTDIIMDNLAVYESDKPVDISFDEEIGGGTVEVAEGEKIYATDLELSNPFTVAVHDNIIEWVDEPGNEENKVLRFERKNANDFCIDLVGINTDATSVVYDFDAKLLNAAETLLGVQLIDDNANHSQACNITEGGIICDATGQQLTTAALKDNEWNNIAVVYNYAKRKQSIYVNGALVKTDIAMDSEFGDPVITGILRFSCPTLVAAAEFDIDDHNAELLIDNVRVYKGTKPCEELIATEGVITIDPNKIVFEDAGYNGKYSTSTFDALLAGYMSLHTRNGMVYKDGIKTKLATMQVETESGFLVVATEICDALGITCTVNDDTVEINNKQADVVRRVCETACILDTSNIRMFSFYLHQGKTLQECREEVIDKVGQMLEVARNYEVNLCHENEAGIYGESPECCHDLLKTFQGELKCVFDMGNFVLDGFKPYPDAYELLKPYIQYFHIKDALHEGAIVPPGCGKGMIKEIISQYICDFNKDVIVTLEPHLETFDGLNALVGKQFENPYKYETEEAAFLDALGKIKEIIG